MNKYPTRKSRIAAYAGAGCILSSYVAMGWFTPPIARYIPPMLWVAAVGFMFLAKSIREREGVQLEIPVQLKGQIKQMANVEIAFSLLSGLSVLVVVIATMNNIDKSVQRLVFCVSIVAFLLNYIASYFIYRRFKHLIATTRV